MSITPHESSSLKLNDPSRTANLKEFIEKIQTLHDTLPYRNLSADAVEMLCQDLKYIANALEKLNKFEDDLGKTLEDLNHNMDEIMDDANTSTNLKQIQDSASLLKNTISILKIKAPRQQQQQHFEARTSHTSGDTEIEIEDPPSESFLIEFHRNFKEEIADQGLMQKCLLCLAVFPKNAEISRRLLKLWWLGEDLVPSDGDGDNETFVDKTLEKFVQLGFLEPLEKERRPGGKAKSFKVPRLVRAALIKRAKDAKFFDFGENESPIADSSGCRRVCLVNNEENQALEKSLGDITTVFNVSESFPDLRISQRSLSKMRRLQVLYLGRWEENTPERYIEVENIGVLKALRNVRRLRYLSLHGMSKITKLPRLWTKLSRLRILDLRACYNLEQLPEGLDFMWLLTYLDISDCFYIDFMPRTLAKLRHLEVLKGFVISGMEGSCSLTQLAEDLYWLNKLSIVINRKDFDVEGLKDELSLFKRLRIVKVAWNSKPLSNTRINAGEYEGLELLEKLDLEGYPKEQPPSWLRPEYLPRLKRLYIRGGNLGKLVEGEGEKKWKVEVLRLKYLSDLEMDWKQLNAMFPDLNFLERVKCPKVTNCPCDGNGIWIKTARSIESGSSSSVV